MMATLNVYMYGIPAGTLTDDGLSFSYLPEYLQRHDAQELSQSLPLSSQTYSRPETEAFFSNLLPDERIRQTLARILHVSPENTFGMLRELGEDCAGSIALFELGKSPDDSSKPEYLPLSEKETSQILEQLDAHPLNISTDNTDFRLSGAGSQNKLVACYFGCNFIFG